MQRITDALAVAFYNKKNAIGDSKFYNPVEGMQRMKEGSKG